MLVLLGWRKSELFSVMSQQSRDRIHSITSYSGQNNIERERNVLERLKIGSVNLGVRTSDEKEWFVERDCGL